MPPHKPSHPQRLTLEAPFYGKLSALLLGKLRGDGLKIALLARLDALPVFTIRFDAPGMKMGFTPDNKEALMAVNVAQRG
jgi:hypothetical protein